MYHDRHYTLQEAQLLLEKMRPIIEEIVELKSILDQKGYDIYRHQYFGGIGPNGTGTFPPELEKLISYLKRISENGVLVKSINEGLLDFPHIRKNGEEVYLCWKSGEDKIMYWHRIEEGFGGRQSVDTL